MNRVFLTKLHLVTAALMFPAVLMFLITGALYTWGNKGAWYEDAATVDIGVPLASLDEAEMQAAARRILAERDLPEPSGNLAVTTGEGASLTWNGARSEIELAPGDTAGSVNATIREASLHRWLVQLHKAKGSTAFKVYASALAAVLALLVFSGVVMGLQVRALRKLTIGSSLAGLAAFVGFVLLG